MSTDPSLPTSEKVSTQAETGEGRSLARPGGADPLADTGSAGGIGSVGIGGISGGTSGMSGMETNDAMPGGGAVGGQPMPDTVAPDEAPDQPSQE